jgi:capsular exopolysaccharide synthesis family protein
MCSQAAYVEEDVIDLRKYLVIALKWWRLLIVCTVVAAGAAFLVSSLMTPTYEASTVLMIGSGMEGVSPTTAELQTSEKLAQTYAELVKTRPVLDAAQAALGLPEEPRVSVALIGATRLLHLTVTDTDPARAAVTADEVARQLIMQGPSARERQEQVYRQFVEDQLSQLQSEIDALTLAMTEARDSGQADTVIRYHEELNARRATYSDLLRFLSSSSPNYIRVIEPAEVPTEPTAPRKLQNTVLAALVGLMLAGGAALLIEYLDVSIKGREDVEQVLGLPVLGQVAIFSPEDQTPNTLVTHDLFSAQAESFRMLYTNLRYSVPSSSERRVFLVASPLFAEGKSTIAANLALTMAMAGKKTVMVDADMRRPRQHDLLGQPTERGLSSLLVGEVSSAEEVLQKAKVEGLWLLPCGTIPPNPAELLASPRMLEILAELERLAEVIVLDSPPLLSVADANILAALATGTILVAEVGRTSREACADALVILRRANANTLGVVLNRVSVGRRGGYGYGGYYHYAYGAGSATEGGASPRWRRFLALLPSWRNRKVRGRPASGE